MGSSGGKGGGGSGMAAAPAMNGGAPDISAFMTGMTPGAEGSYGVLRSDAPPDISAFMAQSEMGGHGGRGLTWDSKAFSDALASSPKSQAQPTPQNIVTPSSIPQYESTGGAINLPKTSGKSSHMKQATQFLAALQQFIGGK